MKFLKVIASEFLRVFGALWFIVEATSFFVSSEASETVKSFWWLFLLTGVVISIVKLIPKRRFQFKLNDRDITIELVVGDIFKQQGPIIVGSNTNFITSQEIISSDSIQGQFSTKYFTNVSALNSQIESQVNNGPWSLGTTVVVHGSEKIGYFCAIAEMNKSGIAKSNIENIRISLAELWNWLSSNAEKDILNVPILGSGLSRVSVSREALAKEIISSFIASTREHTYCDGIRLVVLPNDIKKYKINIEELARFVEYNCIYSFIPPEIGGTVGTAET